MAAVRDRACRTVVLIRERWAYIVEGHRQLDGYELALHADLTILAKLACALAQAHDSVRRAA